jgi:nucleotide-binding universal stress UspA family protein
MKTSRPLLILRPNGSTDSLVAALRRLDVSRRFNGRIIVEADAVGSPALNRKLRSWECKDEHVASAHRAAQWLRERLLDYSTRIGTEVRTRLTAGEVARAAIDHQADMVIVSRGLPRAGLAGLAVPFEAHVCRLAPCPVWCAGLRPLNSRVAVAVTPNTASDEIRNLNLQLVRQSAVLAASTTDEPELHLIAACKPFGLTGDWWRRRIPTSTDLIRNASQAAQEELAMLTAVAKRRGLRVQIHLVEGAAPAAILNLLGEIDPSLLVVGNRQRTGIRRALHVNTVEPVLKRASCSVLSVIAGQSEPWSLSTTDMRQAGERTERSFINAVA